jgi:serine O-acetyltransferase
MNAALHAFLKQGFDTLYQRYAPEWIDLAVAMANESRALIFSDVVVKYPDVLSGEAGEVALARILDTDATIVGTVLYRLSHALYRREPKHEALRYFAHFMRVRTAMEIYYSTEIGPRFRIEHGMGLVIGPRNRIGTDFTVHQGVTLGQRRTFSPHESMTIGNHCVLYAGAAILGAVTLGDHVKLAANAVLLTDAEAGATYAGVPAVKVRGAAA